MSTPPELPEPSLSGAARRSRLRALIAPTLLGLILSISALAGVLHLSGVRWFMVETPSMGSAAPVGTLVVTHPVQIGTVQVGQVIAFRPPSEPGRVYTHRVVAIAHGQLQTRGDLNGAADGWRLRQADLIGEAVVLLPGVGFLMRAVPMLLAGNAVIWLATRWIRGATVRAAVRNIGFGAVAALPSFVLHPFIRIQVLTTQPADDHLAASIVSTGLLPVTVTADTGAALPLHDGQLGTMLLPVSQGGYRLQATIDLPFWGWVALTAVCLLPLAWSLIIGLPPTDELEQDAAPSAEAAEPATVVPEPVPQ